MGSGVALKYVPASTELRVKGDPVQLQQVVLNLIMNAMDATSGADVRSREISVTTVHAGSYAEVRVATPVRASPPVISRTVFDPFFTTKPQGMGMGLDHRPHHCRSASRTDFRGESAVGWRAFHGQASDRPRRHEIGMMRHCRIALASQQGVLSKPDAAFP